MRLGFVVLFLISLSGNSWAKTYTTFGVGNESCATWLSNPVFENQGVIWLVGFWSGLNNQMAYEGTGGDTGISTDGLGIVGEVKKACKEHPSETLAITVRNVFDNFLKAGK